MRRRLPRLLAVLLAAVAGLAVAGCGGDDEGGDPQGGPAQKRPPDRAGCRRVEAPPPKGEQDLERPTTRLSRDRTWTAQVTTNCGRFDIRLDVRRAPRTTGAFAALARDGFYDGLTFHRLDPQFVVQGGDPSGDGTGGPGFSVREAPPGDLVYRRGVVAMAKTEVEPAGTSGSQFFVVLAEATDLPAEYALLGRVSGGQGTLDRIAAVPVGAGSEQPAEPIVIERIRIEGS